MRCAHSPFRLVLLLVASVFFIHATLRAQEPSEKAVIANMDALKFVTFPNLPDCFTGAVVKGDPNQGASVFLIKGSAGCGVPWHWHTPNEEVMMVTGTARLQMKEEKRSNLSLCIAKPAFPLFLHSVLSTQHSPARWFPLVVFQR